MAFAARARRSSCCRPPLAPLNPGNGRSASYMDAFNSRYKQHQHEVWADFYLKVDVVVK